MPSTENYAQDQVLSFLTNSAVVKNLGAKLAAGREIDEAGTSGERIVGIIKDTETSTGIDVGVVTGPCFKLGTSAASYSDLDPLSVSAAGKFQTATAGHVVVAIAMEAASAADQEKLVLLLPMSQYRVASASVVDLTDSTGLSGTHDDTLAATSVPADLTGGEDPTEAEHNALLAVTRVIAQNVSDVAQKVKEIIAVLDAQGITL
jgi:hypothetical protein